MKLSPRIAVLMALGLLVSALLTGCNTATNPSDDSTAATAQDTHVDTADTADGTESEIQADTMSCTVTVLDYKGNPMPDVVVSVLKDGNEVKKNVSKADGTAKFTLDISEYSILLDSPNGKFYYDESAARLTPDATELTITLYHMASETDTVTIWPSGGEYQAPILSEGATYVSLGSGMTYVVFRPSRDGVYEISYMSDANIDIGYYGAPMVVFDTKMADTVDGKVSLSIARSSISTDGEATAMFVFGLEPEAADTKGCIVTITRTGDPEKTPADEPWVEYKPTQVKAYEGTVTGTFKDIDVTNPANNVVYNEADGYYHFNAIDGPVVFIRITTDSPYITSLTGIAEKSRVGVYQYDENGKFAGKESYHDMIAAYAEIVNDDGVCPLTPELEYMIKSFGEYQKWWDLSFSGNIFQDKIVTPETAWLFICGYYS